MTDRIRLAAPLAAAALLTTAAAVEAAPARTSVDLSLREGPSTRYQRLTVVPQGARVEVARCTPSYEWCEVSWRGYDGWSAARYLQPAAPELRAPVAELQGRFPAEVFDFFAEFGLALARGEEPDVGPPEDRGPAVARGEACFYADFDYQGESVCSQGGADPRLSGGWNDRISAIRTGPGTAVLVCEHYDYEGRCRRIAGNVASLSSEWNDVISSYEIGGRVPPDQGDEGPPVDANEVCFYEDYEFGGAELCADVGDADARIMGEWNDRISAIRTGANATVEVCQDYGFAGGCRTVDGTVSALRGGWNDAISAYRVR
ncbi:peptidase inhibitor family I36 protein [Salinarimonas sp.]|uniref:peptidase inhibitor family I36 protein n=1 Tax=Salinarimonas sp. TaxID=2766526 RepID=UPI0032D8F392